MINTFTPKQIVAELDRFIIGQEEAKKAVALALRNRYRRMNVEPKLREEIVPKNILMVGPTGVGKTEISRRLAKLANAPFIKVEATKFTEIGYVGRDVEGIIRDLLDLAINQAKEAMKKDVETKATENTDARLLEALVGPSAGEETKEKFKRLLNEEKLEDKEIEVSVLDNSNASMPTFDVPGMPGAQMGMISLGDILGKSGERFKTKKLSVAEARKLIMEEEVDKLLDFEKVTGQAIKNVENNGIVFIDEIDKICGKDESKRGDVSREGVQRDLLPLIEGTNVTTKYGMVKTDHILFICSGAFHFAKPADLLPELQGRLPIRVELKGLTYENFIAILTETEANLIEQYVALLKTEGFDLEFSFDAIEEIARTSVLINENVENIGARRLHTVFEILLEDISFYTSERSGEKEVITSSLVEEKLGKYTKESDLSKFIL